MHPTIAQGFVQHHQAALHQEAQQSRLAAQARAGRTGPSWRQRVVALAARVQGAGVAGPLAASAQAAVQASAVQASAAMPAHGPALSDPTPGADQIAARSRHPASWARARAISFGPAGRTMSGPPDVTPPSPAL
jgi:hypothetical protein